MRKVNLVFYSICFFIIILNLCCRQVKTEEKNTVPHKAGYYSCTITCKDLERTFDIFIPSSYDKSKSISLVIAIHGGYGNAKSMEKLTEFSKVAEKEGFIIVYPEGIDKQWNDGRKMDEKASKENIDDAGFISSLIDHLEKNINIDRNRVYATGISNGGHMCYRLAFELSDKIAAFAPVAASLSEELYKNHKNGKSVPMLIINGTDDKVVWNGGEIKFLGKSRDRVLSTEDTVKFWVSYNHCKSEAAIISHPDKDRNDDTEVEEKIYRDGKDGTEVILYTVEGGGHTWPGGWQYLPENIVGKTCRDINASEVIWKFFRDCKKI